MSAKKGFKIGEVCKLLDIQPYVLRYWETEFVALHPAKSTVRAAGLRRRRGRGHPPDQGAPLRRGLHDRRRQEAARVAGGRARARRQGRQRSRLSSIRSRTRPQRRHAEPAAAAEANGKSPVELDTTLSRPDRKLSSRRGGGARGSPRRPRDPREASPLNSSAFGRDVAQSGSVPEWGSGGPGFKSRRPDQFQISIKSRI